MAYGFGSGVRAELGATDYSNYLRGALTGAQMQAQGGAAIGAGVQNALAGIGEGIQKYQQNKILQSEIMGGVEENVDFLVNNNPESIQNAPKAVQDVLRRMEDGKGVSLKDSAYLKSWSDSATKQAKDNIENNALVSAISPNPDGTYPPGQQMVTTYYGSGGRNQSLMAALLAFGKDPVQVDLLNAQIGRVEQQIEGTVPPAAYRQANLTAFNAAMDSEDPQRRAEIYMKTMSDLGFEPDMQVASELRLQVPPGESSDTYSQASAYTNESGSFIGYGVINKNTGQLMLSPVGGGPLTEMPEGSIPSTLAKASGSPVSFETFSGVRRGLMDKKRTIARMEKYLETQGKTEKGFDRMANAFTGAIKTLMGKGLSEAEIQQQIAAGELQGIVGLVRESVGGPGVMTEGDVARILDYLGGSVSALQDPEVVKRAIAGAMMNTYREYIDALPDYDYLLKTQFGSKYDPMEAPELSTEMKAILIAQGLL